MKVPGKGGALGSGCSGVEGNGSSTPLCGCGKGKNGFAKLAGVAAGIRRTGRPGTAYVTVTNSGEVAGDAGYLDLWADSSALPATPVPGSKTKGNKYKTVGKLQPGQEKVITATGLKASAGTAWTLGVLIDSRAKTLELDETNNWLEFDYGASATPPLPPPPPG